MLDYYYFNNVPAFGIKNFRTDNMSSYDFTIILKSTRSYKTNNDWKTAHMVRMPFINNPHWNLYSCYCFNHNMPDNYTDTDTYTGTDTDTDTGTDMAVSWRWKLPTSGA